MSSRGATEARPESWFELSGGALCLDFANTVSERPSAEPIERLETYADLLEWARRAGLLTASASRRWAEAARQHPRTAARQLAEAREAREQLYQLFAGFAASRTQPQTQAQRHEQEREQAAAFDAFNARLHRLLAKTMLRRRAGGRDGPVAEWGYAGATVAAPRGPHAPGHVHDASDPEHAGDLDALLWPIWWSAAALLTAGADGQLRQCEARDCGWLFLDRSRGHRRRWCDMRVCGNREKLRRFRASATGSTDASSA